MPRYAHRLDRYRKGHHPRAFSSLRRVNRRLGRGARFAAGAAAAAAAAGPIVRRVANFARPHNLAQALNMLRTMKYIVGGSTDKTRKRTKTMYIPDEVAPPEPSHASKRKYYPSKKKSYYRKKRYY